MTVFCTYCSAEKDPSEGELPAIQRYLSPRIQSVYAAAKRLGLRFLILSGEFGILEPDDPIPYYDHLLLPSEVPEHAKRVADQLKDLDVKDMIFFTRSDAAVKPYLECMKSACQIAGAELKFVTLLEG
jgi:hypothetical protein